MIQQYYDTAKRLAQECWANGHDSCQNLYIDMFGPADVNLTNYDPDMRTVYSGTDELVITALGASLPSPDGQTWNEFHHIYGRAHSPIGRLVSHDLHARAHSHGIAVQQPEVVFHCLQPALNWARLYNQGVAAVLPDRPSEQMWMLRIAHEYHFNNGQEIDAAVRHLDTHLTSTLHSYIWNIRRESWSSDGTVQLNNICPSLYPSMYLEWSKDVKSQLNSWYYLTARQKQYANHLTSIAGHMGTTLARNGMELVTLQELTSTYRMAEAIYRVAYDIHNGDRDHEEQVERFVEILEETADDPDAARAKRIIEMWFVTNPTVVPDPATAPQYRRKGYYTDNTIILTTSMPNTDENFRRASDVYEMLPLEGPLEFEEW